MAPLPTMVLCYATRDGQSRRVAERIAARLDERGVHAPPHDLAVTVPAPALLAAARLVVVVAAVRYGRHLAAADRFLGTYRALPAQPSLVLVSVNLTARKPGKDTAEGNRYLQKTIARHRLQPALATAIAGRLDYPHYGWLDRQIIRLIMRLTGGPTDPRSTVEFTAWDAVDALAVRIAGLHGTAGLGNAPSRDAGEAS
jgi:menaquinone-dependent protoporphyrinogen oxidase